MKRERQCKRFHLAVKIGSDSARTRLRWLRIALSAVLSVAAGVLIVKAGERMCAAWNAQFAVDDVLAQVTIRSTPHISDEMVRQAFGLTNGCNLATIDFAACRRRTLERQPLIRSIVIDRRGKTLEIAVEERKPVARINLETRRVSRGGKTSEIHLWDAVDSEGVVFSFNRRDTVFMPAIKGLPAAVRRGGRISGRALSALRMIEICAANRDLAVIGLDSVSVANSTYMQACTKDYSIVKIDWQLLDEPTDPRQKNLRLVLTNLRDTIEKRLTPPRCTYSVSGLDRVCVLPYEKDPIP